MSSGDKPRRKSISDSTRKPTPGPTVKPSPSSLRLQPSTKAPTPNIKKSLSPSTKSESLKIPTPKITRSITQSQQGRSKMALDDFILPVPAQPFRGYSRRFLSDCSVVIFPEDPTRPGPEYLGDHRAGVWALLQGSERRPLQCQRLNSYTSKRILFRNKDDLLCDYELNTVTFGVNCAPFLAIRVLQQLSKDVQSQYPLASVILSEHITPGSPAGARTNAGNAAKTITRSSTCVSKAARPRGSLAAPLSQAPRSDTAVRRHGKAVPGTGAVHHHGVGHRPLRGPPHLDLTPRLRRRIQSRQPAHRRRLHRCSSTRARTCFPRLSSASTWETVRLCCWRCTTHARQ
ncbi:hypothetical protein ACLKA6_019203 [Drosophila palustris]